MTCVSVRGPSYNASKILLTIVFVWTLSIGIPTFLLVGVTTSELSPQPNL